MPQTRALQSELDMKPCWAQYLLWLVIAVLGAGSMLSACGRKGDLYLPDQHPQQHQKNDRDSS